MNLYEQLGVEQTATQDEIKRSYYRLVRQHTPEKEPEVFMRLRKAYEELSDEKKRAAYDGDLARFTGIHGKTTAVIMEAERLTDKGLGSDALGLILRELNVHLKSGVEKISSKDFLDIALSNTSDRASVLALLLALGKTYLSMGKSGKAASIATKLTELDPENLEYLRFAMDACIQRGWTMKAFGYLNDLMSLDPGSDDVFQSSATDFNMPLNAYVDQIKTAEMLEKKTPYLCAYVLGKCLANYSMSTLLKPLGQVSPFPHPYLLPQPWDDPVFTANKLVEHTTDAHSNENSNIIELMHESVLYVVFMSKRFDVFPQIKQAFSNLGANESIFQSSEFKMVSLSYTALEAVQAGIPKILAAHSLVCAYSQSDIFYGATKESYRNEVIAFEFDILLEYRGLKPFIAQLRKDFNELYKYSAPFLETANKYNEQKAYDEAKRRLPKLKHMDKRLALDWLGEDDFDSYGDDDDDEYGDEYDDEYNDEYGDDDGDMYGDAGSVFTKKNEPVQVTKVGRNEPCPCGSKKKYKKCCGR